MQRGGVGHPDKFQEKAQVGKQVKNWENDSFRKVLSTYVMLKPVLLWLC